MFLITFVFFVIGILGIYTQVLAVETARIYQSQTGIAQTMLNWHAAAMSLAGNVIEPTMGPGGCRLTAPVWTGAPGICTTGPAVAPSSWPATVSGGPYFYPAAPTPVSFPNLAVGYAPGGPYQWKSIAYTTGASYYVVTYIDPPATAGGFVSTASALLGVTQADLFQQIKNNALPIDAYGYVSAAGGTLNTFAILPGVGPVSYTVPASIPPGSLGIITNPGKCSGC